MEDIINAIATDASASEVSDALKMHFLQKQEKELML